MTTPNTSSARTDADIFVDVRAALDRSQNVPAGVRVHVDHGIATLTGTVQWAAERTNAEEVARGVAGVQRLVNEIVVAEVPSAEGFERPDRNE